MSTGEKDYLLPQIYFYSTTPNLYLELGNMYYLGTSSLTKDDPFYYGRYIAKLNLSKSITFGPQVELTVDLAEGVDERVSSLVLGGVVDFLIALVIRLIFS